MEDIQPISAAEQGPFCVELMKRLNIHRKQDYLCDITLVSIDNIEFKAHRNVLSAASPYFDKLLQSNMKENREGIVRFEEISGSVLKDVLEFIYSGTVDVTQENAEKLIAAGNYMIMLEDVVTNELVRENLACVKLVMDAAMKMATLIDEDHLPQLSRKGQETRVIVARGGKNCFCYFPEENLWKRLPDGLKDKRVSSNQMIKFRNQLFIFSEYDDTERYDPAFNVWSELNLYRGSAKLVVLKGEIYAVEVSIYNTKTTIKKYNVKRCTWETLISSCEGCREYACVIAAGSHLYLFGGKIPYREVYVATAERFDTVENKWEEIVDMHEGRNDAFGVAAENKIFVAGVLRNGKKLKTCEIYNISTNEWQLVAKLNVPRCYGSMVCLNGKLYVLGGENNRNQNERSVECFDPANDQWIHETTIPDLTNSSSTGSVLKLSRELLDKLTIL